MLLLTKWNEQIFEGMYFLAGMLPWFLWDEEDEEFSKIPKKEKRKNEYKPDGLFKKSVEESYRP